MPTIKNVSGEDRIVPALGGRFVKAGQQIEVAEDQVYGFTQQTDVWAPVDAPAEQAHVDGHDAYLERRSEELGGVPVDNAGARIPPPDPSELEEPAGNASREEWVDYVLTAQLATEDDLEGKGRDEIRDAYRKPDPAPDPEPDQTGDQAPGDTDSTDGSN